MFARSLLSFAALTAASVWAQGAAIAEETPSVCTVMIAEGRPESGEYRIVFSTEIPPTPTFTCCGVNGGDRWAISGEWRTQGNDRDLKLNFEYGTPEGRQQRLATRIVVPPGDSMICLGGMNSNPEGTPKRQSLILLRRSAPDTPPPTAHEIAEAAKALDQHTIAATDGQGMIKWVQTPSKAYLGDVPFLGRTFSSAAHGQNPWQSGIAKPSSVSAGEMSSESTAVLKPANPAAAAEK